MVDPEGIMLCEMSDRERQIQYNLIFLWNLKKKKVNSDTENRLVVASLRGAGGQNG